MKALRKVTLGMETPELREVPEPIVIPKHVLIEVAAAGICGTDLHILKDEYPSDPPVTLGHEVAGTVYAVGEGVTDWQVGQRVVSETYFTVCNLCEYCRSGRPNLCPARRSIGSMEDGAFARYVLVPAANLHALPANLGFPEAALVEPLACVVRGLLELGRVTAGDKVVVTGPGAIGLLALQVAQAAGASVVVIGTEMDAQRLELARALGGASIVAGEDTEAVEREIRAHLGDAPDVVIECSGSPSAVRTLFALVKKGGRLIQLGLYGRPVSLDLDQVCYKELRLTGSFATTPSSWRRALKLVETGKVSLKAIVGRVYPLEAWREAFTAVQSGVAGKVLLLP